MIKMTRHIKKKMIYKEKNNLVTRSNLNPKI